VAQVFGSLESGRLLGTELDEVVVRRELDPGDVDAIVDLHDRVHRAEYGADEHWVQTIRFAIKGAVQRGWPRERALGSVRLLERDDRIVGSLALVLQCPRVGNLDWFVLDAELRGRGLGRRLVSDLVAEARTRRMDKLKVETFSKLTAAARIYRGAGFSVAWQQEMDWHGERVTHQLYELTLEPAVTPSPGRASAAQADDPGHRGWPPPRPCHTVPSPRRSMSSPSWERTVDSEQALTAVGDAALEHGAGELRRERSRSAAALAAVEVLESEVGGDVPAPGTPGDHEERTASQPDPVTGPLEAAPDEGARETNRSTRAERHRRSFRETTPTTNAVADRQTSCGRCLCSPSPPARSAGTHAKPVYDAGGGQSRRSASSAGPSSISRLRSSGRYSPLGSSPSQSTRR
jgi:GNAT superfamily N-acetyltransferase